MKFFKVNEAAAFLGISKQTLVRYEKRGVFPRSRRNAINKWREFTEDDIKKMQAILGRGFTLIELVMVIVIVGVLAALAVPRFNAFSSAKLSSAANKLVSDLRYVQQLAVSRHTTYRVYFDTSLDRYEVRDVSDNSLAKDPFSRQDFIVSFRTDPQFSGVDINTASFGSTAGLLFNWEGVPQNNNSVNLTGEGNVQLRLGGESRTVYVRPGTGTLRVQ